MILEEEEDISLHDSEEKAFAAKDGADAYGNLVGRPKRRILLAGGGNHSVLCVKAVM